MAHDEPKATGPTKLVIRNIGLVLSGALETPILDADTIVAVNGKITGVFTDYHYYGTGDIGGSPDEDSVKRLEAIVTHGQASLPPPGYVGFPGEKHETWAEVSAGDGPVNVISSTADQMFLNITPDEAARLPVRAARLRGRDRPGRSAPAQRPRGERLHAAAAGPAGQEVP